MARELYEKCWGCKGTRKLTVPVHIDMTRKTHRNAQVGEDCPLCTDGYCADGRQTPGETVNLFEFIVRRRFYIWNGDICSIVYECMDEEGAGVKKKLTQGTEQHCKRFLAEAQKQWKAWLEANFTLSTTGSTEHPPTAADIEAKLPKPKLKKKPNKKEVVVKTPNITMTSTDSFDPEQR